MAKEGPAAGSSSELERGEVPEVAALGNALTSLFNTLEVTQNAYAVRISMDKSIVSRYLRGRRVATEDFIDRLMREVEVRRGASVQPEVRRRVTKLRLDALKVTDPATYELEELRAEMLESGRKVQMLVRHQEALHDLLEKRESAVRAVQEELETVRQDWTVDLARAERAEVELRERVERHSTERGRLFQEITRLKAEISEIARLKAGAEQRCAELEEQVSLMEEELATRLGATGEPALPLAALKGQLAELVEAGEQREASREVVEAAWGRPIGELAELVEWLRERRDHSRADRLITEVVHARKVGELAEFGNLVRSPRGYLPTILVKEAADIRRPQEIILLQVEWGGVSQPLNVKESILNFLCRSLRDESEVVETLALLDPNDATTFATLKGIRARTGYEQRYVTTVTQLESIGCGSVAVALCVNMFRSHHRLKAMLSGLTDRQCVQFTHILLRSEPIELITHWLVREFDFVPVPIAEDNRLDHRVAIFADTLRDAGRLSEVRTVIAATTPRGDYSPSLLRYLESAPPQPERDSGSRNDREA
ncbi:hypothetical protein [Streptomyces sp. YS415]|uniref:hypothetical protein n=1 Tax=Streptomyces sp. YS415 TaxID=2944806 RepID=UPI0020229852|nr:hypothetical protein [Streptomyces sp. YS415]MCL7426916.1 hypothetical protein [Streptomyces sp. YS415]